MYLTYVTRHFLSLTNLRILESFINFPARQPFIVSPCGYMKISKQGCSNLLIRILISVWCYYFWLSIQKSEYESPIDNKFMILAGIQRFIKTGFLTNPELAAIVSWLVPCLKDTGDICSIVWNPVLAKMRLVLSIFSPLRKKFDPLTFLHTITSRHFW